MEKDKSTEVITQKEEQILEVLAAQKFMRNFYLAGGTSLALQIHHRRSVDLDFFSSHDVNPDRLAKNLKRLFRKKCEILKIEKGTLHAQTNNSKISFLEYKYPLLEKRQKVFLRIKLAGMKDIAAMKISAIQSRGAKRDFIDIYFMIKYYFKLSEMIALYKKKFGTGAYSEAIIFKSLNYFSDADKEPSPILFKLADWKSIKSFLISETVKYFGQRIE